MEKYRAEKEAAKKKAFSAPKPNLCSRLQSQINRAIINSGGKVQPILSDRKSAASHRKVKSVKNTDQH